MYGEQQGREPHGGQIGSRQATLGAPAKARVLHAYFPAFDVFRGIGILFVIAAHTPVQSSLLDVIRPIGALGVHMFFALSGFLITYRLLEEFAQTAAVDLPAFYRRRARRILPPALIYLALLALLGPGLHVFQTSIQELSASLFFYRNVFRPPLPGAWYTAHFWTLSLEEQFYLFWPSVLVLLGPKRRRTIWVTLGLILACVVWRIHIQRLDPATNVYRPDLLADHLLWGLSAWVVLADTASQLFTPSANVGGSYWHRRRDFPDLLAATVLAAVFRALSCTGFHSFRGSGPSLGSSSHSVPDPWEGQLRLLHLAVSIFAPSAAGPRHANLAKRSVELCGDRPSDGRELSADISPPRKDRELTCCL